MDRVVTVEQEAGLHARPAAVFVEKANEYDSAITVAPVPDESDGANSGDGDQTDEEANVESAAVDAGSMLAVTGLGVEYGDRVHITADGPDAEAALDELEALLTRPEP